MKLKKIINLFGGPGVGKSTVAAGLFYKMKEKGYSVEYVSEYAKDLTHENRMNILYEDQLYIFAKQHRKIYRLIDQYEYLIVDSPLIFSIIYARLSTSTLYNLEIFQDFITSIYNKYPNVNILLMRNNKFKYLEDGRYQNKVGAEIIDVKIKQLVLSTCIEYTEIKVDEDSVNKILQKEVFE